mmetsp:Transcript_50658/g.151528  ORF Transcript_50658/g.151528 Transcript_50658/m.151528 type:complete len:413 (+) Transcript_50658:480-1718(+)
MRRGCRPHLRGPLQPRGMHRWFLHRSLHGPRLRGLVAERGSACKTAIRLGLVRLPPVAVGVALFPQLVQVGVLRACGFQLWHVRKGRTLVCWILHELDSVLVSVLWHVLQQRHVRAAADRDAKVEAERGIRPPPLGLLLPLARRPLGPQAEQLHPLLCAEACLPLLLFPRLPAVPPLKRGLQGLLLLCVQDGSQALGEVAETAVLRERQPHAQARLPPTLLVQQPTEALFLEQRRHSAPEAELATAAACQVETPVGAQRQHQAVRTCLARAQYPCLRLVSQCGRDHLVQPCGTAFDAKLFIRLPNGLLRAGGLKHVTNVLINQPITAAFAGAADAPHTLIPNLQLHVVPHAWQANGVAVAAVSVSPTVGVDAMGHCLGLSGVETDGARSDRLHDFKAVLPGESGRQIWEWKP